MPSREFLALVNAVREIAALNEELVAEPEKTLILEMRRHLAQYEKEVEK